MCSKRWANPVRPWRSLREATLYTTAIEKTGATWSSEMMRRRPFLSLLSVNFTDGAVSADSDTAAVSAPIAAASPAYRRTRIRVMRSSCLMKVAIIVLRLDIVAQFSAGCLVGGRRFQRPDHGRRGRSQGRSERLPRTRDESAGVGDREADAVQVELAVHAW